MFVLVSEPQVMSPEQGESDRETSETAIAETAPSEVTSHTSMRTQVSHQDGGKEDADSDDRSSSYSSASSHSEVADIARKPPPTQVEHKHLSKRDTFFDQTVSEHDYSSVIEALSQGKDADLGSNKPAYSARGRSISESSSSGSETSDSDSDTGSDTAFLSRKDMGDDGSPRNKQNDGHEKMSATEVKHLRSIL